jgi:hypothetical protein
LTIRRLASWGRKRALCAGVGGAALAVLAGTALPAATGAATASAASAVTLSAGPLGIDVAPWDPVYSNPATFNAVQPLLKAAGVDELHYGGGTTADVYDWQTNNDVSNCPASTPATSTAACAYKDALDFTQYSANARALDAQSFVTVNYGSGTAALAAAWVKQAADTPGQEVADFEIGNESYGCWEADNWLAAPPEDYVGYKPNVNATCPMNVTGQADGMAIMANSYAANAGKYMAAMKAADPNAQIGFPWAFDNTVGGASVGDNGTWNNTILDADGADIGFVDAHWYPYGFGGNAGAGTNPTAQQVIQSVTQIPQEYQNIENTLTADGDPAAKVIVGETGVSFLATNVPCTPAGALFAAGDALSWLAAGAQSIDWWPLDTNANLGSTCTNPDEGMFTNTGAPMSPYTGYQLASALTQPNAKLSALTTTNSQVLGFQSVLANGQPVVAYINTNTGSAEEVNAATPLTGLLSTESYSAGDQNATNTKTVTGTSTASAIAGGITLPAESIMVLKEDLQKPSAMTLTTGGSSNTFKAGTKVTLKGKLTLNGAAAPAGVPVKVAREVSGKTQATLTVKTVAGGTFTVTDVPPAAGSYVYAASYVSNTYVPATASYTVKVTATKPALKLTVSAKSVKPGQKVTVTATLGAPHTNRTLIIYAQAKGSAKKVIKRGTVNSKGQLAVLFPMKTNTTFTVVFAGDTWYTTGSAAVGVTA